MADLKFAFESISRKFHPLKNRMISFLFIVVSKAPGPSLTAELGLAFCHVAKISKNKLMLRTHLPYTFI